jgi:quinol monooxygenase YgiN
MTVIGILELTLKPDAVDDARAFFGRILVDSRAFEGCEGIDVLIAEGDDTHWVLYERWRDEAAHDAYRAWRAGAGATPGLGELIAAPPTSTRFIPSGV